MAVYTTVDAGALTRFLACYDIGAPRRFEGILQGVENTNYELETERGRFVLTLFERRTAARDLPYFLGLMAHLAAAGFPAPKPIRQTSGALSGDLLGKAAAIVTFLPGDWPRDPTADQAAEAGAGLARLHLAAADFSARRPNDLNIDAWRPLFARSADRADDVAPGLKAEIAATLARLEAAWPRGLPSGHIHADLFPDNLFLDGARLSGVIDFYFACEDAYAYDLAIMLNAWCFQAGPAWRDDRAAALTAGYARVRPLSDHERAALPVLQAGGAMRFLLTRLHDWLHPTPGALVRPKDPLEQLACLRLFESQIP